METNDLHNQVVCKLYSNLWIDPKLDYRRALVSNCYNRMAIFESFWWTELKKKVYWLLRVTISLKEKYTIKKRKFLYFLYKNLKKLK